MSSVLRAAAVPLAVLLAAGGCGNSPLAPGLFTLEGAWVGRGYPYELVLNLSQDSDNQVRGDGELRGLRTVRVDSLRTDTVAGTRAPVEVRGTWDYPSFTLRLSADDYADIQMTSRFSTADSVAVTLSGSGFNSAQITLVRTSR